MKNTIEIKILPWTVPNCASLKLEKYTWHSILSPFGILKKLRGINTSTYKFNKDLNISLIKLQLSLISKIGTNISMHYKKDKFGNNLETIEFITYLTSPKWKQSLNNDYFKIAHRILRTSNGYLLRHIWKIEKHYGGKFSKRKIQSLIKEIIHKLYIGDSSISLKRKWLQAPSPKCRSLSIPGLADRIIASMWTEILELYLRGSMGIENHAYQYGKGTQTAWIDLLNKDSYLKGNWKYIYEFDLANFFPSVSHLELIKTLRNLGVPVWTISMLLNPLLNKPQISLDLEVKDYETDNSSVFIKSFYDLINYKGESNFTYNKSSTIGVPMGLGYSPLLATLVLIQQLNKWKSPFNNFITYGDDGILFTNNLNDLKKFQELMNNGKVQINENKSKFFKFEWIYLGNLKFLGLLWNPITDRLYAATRKGSKIEMVRYLMNLPEELHFFLTYLWNSYIKLCNLYKSRSILFESFFFEYCLNHRLAIKEKVFGTLLAKLYQGTYDDIPYETSDYVPFSDSYLISHIKGNKISSFNIHNTTSLIIESMSNEINIIRRQENKWYKLNYKIYRNWEKTYVKNLYKTLLEEKIPIEFTEYMEVTENNVSNKIFKRQLGSRNYSLLSNHLKRNNIKFVIYNKVISK